MIFVITDPTLLSGKPGVEQCCSWPHGWNQTCLRARQNAAATHYPNHFTACLRLWFIKCQHTTSKISVKVTLSLFGCSVCMCFCQGCVSTGSSDLSHAHVVKFDPVRNSQFVLVSSNSWPWFPCFQNLGAITTACTSWDRLCVHRSLPHVNTARPHLIGLTSSLKLVTHQQLPHVPHLPGKRAHFCYTLLPICEPYLFEPYLYEIHNNHKIPNILKALILDKAQGWEHTKFTIIRKTLLWTQPQKKKKRC